MSIVAGLEAAAGLKYHGHQWTGLLGREAPGYDDVDAVVFPRRHNQRRHDAHQAPSYDLRVMVGAIPTLGTVISGLIQLKAICWRPQKTN